MLTSSKPFNCAIVSPSVFAIEPASSLLFHHHSDAVLRSNDSTGISRQHMHGNTMSDSHSDWLAENKVYQQVRIIQSVTKMCGTYTDHQIRNHHNLLHSRPNIPTALSVCLTPSSRFNPMGYWGRTAGEDCRALKAPASRAWLILLPRPKGFDVAILRRAMVRDSTMEDKKGVMAIVAVL